MMRSRAFVVSLAVAAAATSSGVAIQHSASATASATVSSGARPILVQITPCRLADSRPAAPVGPQVGQIGAGETVTYDTQAATEDCAGLIPAGAVGLSLNATALGATVQSFLTFWPSGARPDASSLNPAPGEPPTPNAVTTPIDDGKFNVFNNAGQTHLLIDINGYYINHDHDDLYDGVTPGPSTAGTFSVGAAAFDTWESEYQWEKSLANGNDNGGVWITAAPHFGGGGVPGFAAPVQLPHGATVTSVTGYFTDTSPTASLSFQLRCEELDGDVKIVANGGSTAAPASGEDDMSITTANATIDNSVCSYFFFAESGSWASETDDLKIRGVSITTT